MGSRLGRVTPSCGSGTEEAKRYGVGRAHTLVALVGVRVQVRAQVGVEERDQAAERRAPDEPLEVRSAGMMVWAVEPRSRDELTESTEERFVPGVHPDGYRRLAAVPTEASFADQDPDEQARIKSLQCRSPQSAWACCYTVW